MFYDEIHELFLKRLTELRIEKGVSSREMSLAIGQNKSYINLIENKRHLPSMAVFFYICEYFELTPMEFFDVDLKNPIRTEDLYNKLQLLNDEEANAMTIMLDVLIKRTEKGDKQ